EARRRTPDPRPVLERCHRAVLDAVAADRALLPPWIAIGGKSLGGRIASYLAAAGAPVRGVFFLGYPLHPAGKPDQLRADHLPSVPVPMLFVKGTRDSLCDFERLREVLRGMPRATLHVVEGGDHSFRLPRRNATPVQAAPARLAGLGLRGQRPKGVLDAPLQVRMERANDAGHVGCTGHPRRADYRGGVFSGRRGSRKPPSKLTPFAPAAKDRRVRRI